MQGELVALAEDVVKPQATLVGGVLHRLRGGEQIRTGIRVRIKLNQPERGAVQFVGRNLVVRKRLATKVVDQWNGLTGLWIGEAGEIPAPFRIARHGGALRDTLPVAKAFVEGEDEILILADRASQRNAELVLLQRFNLRGEEVAGIQMVVPEELV